MGSNNVVEYLLTEKAKVKAYSQMRGGRIPDDLRDDFWQMLWVKALEKGDLVQYPNTWCHMVLGNLIADLFNSKRGMGKHFIKVDTKEIKESLYQPDFDRELLKEEVAKRYPREVIVRYFGDDYEATRKNKMKKFRFIEQAKKDFRREESRVRLNSLARKAGTGR